MTAMRYLALIPLTIVKKLAFDLQEDTHVQNPTECHKDSGDEP